MGAGCFCDLLQPGSVELDGKELALARIIGIGSEIEKSCFLIHAVNAKYLEIALGHLSFEFCLCGKWRASVERIEIDVSVSITPTRPEESIARRKDLEVVIHVHPRIDRFGED